MQVFRLQIMTNLSLTDYTGIILTVKHQIYAHQFQAIIYSIFPFIVGYQYSSQEYALYLEII